MAHRSTPELLALHGLRLVGTASAEALADHFGTSVDAIRDALTTALEAGLVEERHGSFPGFRLTDAGRARAAELVAEELAASGGRPSIERSYATFKTLNGRLLDVCSRWQLHGSGSAATPNRHDDPVYDSAVIDDLVGLHAEVAPIVEDVHRVLERFGGHGDRLETAIRRIQAGDHDYVTKPMFPSYHSVWFELHEDFLATLGLERSTHR